MTKVSLPRRRPQRLVQPQPVPEYLADEDLRERYELTKECFEVPWMGVVAMAFAHYRPFYDCLWEGVGINTLNKRWPKACSALRRQAETAAANMTPPDLTADLAALGYAPQELAQIRESLEIFSHGNYPYLLMASLARLLLTGQEMTGEPLAQGELRPLRRSAPQAALVLMEAHHADAPTRALYERVKTKLDLPFVNTDYRALARWPSYFHAAWEALEPQLHTPAHEAACLALHQAAVSAAAELAPQPSLSSEALIAAAERSAPPGEVLAVVELFQWLLPELCVNVALLRAQLDKPANAS
ncbi:MAG: hypothetical protein AAFY02_15825 [Pseudomonadota bacterium]